MGRQRGEPLRQSSQPLVQPPAPVNPHLAKTFYVSWLLSGQALYFVVLLGQKYWVLNVCVLQAVFSSRLWWPGLSLGALRGGLALNFAVGGVDRSGLGRGIQMCEERLINVRLALCEA